MMNLEPNNAAWPSTMEAVNESVVTEMEALRTGAFEHWNNWATDEFLKFHRLEQAESPDSSIWLG